LDKAEEVRVAKDAADLAEKQRLEQEAFDKEEEVRLAEEAADIAE